MENVVKTEKQLLAKEYGSNILKLVEHLLTISDKKERTEKAELLKKLILKMHPSLKYAENCDNKIWSAMFIMSDLKLDIDVEFEKVSEEMLVCKPKMVEYEKKKPKFRHYGKNIELIMEKIIAEKDEEKRNQAIIGIGKLMKMFYGSWNKEINDNQIIANQISKLSDGKVKVPAEILADATVFDTRKATGRSNVDRPAPKSNNKNWSNKNRNNNKNNNNRNHRK